LIEELEQLRTRLKALETAGEESTTSTTRDTNERTEKVMSSGPQNKTTSYSRPKETAGTETKEHDTAELRKQITHLQHLLEFLESEFGPSKKAFTDLTANGQITYDMLWRLFRLGKCVVFDDVDSDLRMAGQVPSCNPARIDQRFSARDILFWELQMSLNSMCATLTTMVGHSTMRGVRCMFPPSEVITMLI
jgi:hypothetical protein